MISVHDNAVYSHAVDYENRRLVLHTYYPHSQLPEYTDIRFDGVVAHHIETQAFGSLANILFDAEESDPAFTLANYTGLLTATKNYGWPVFEYEDVDDLARRFQELGVKCFAINSSCGLSGFVFAASMVFQSRSSRAQTVDFS